MTLSRTASFESIPDVEFMIHSIEKDLGEMQISNFKTKEAAGLLLPEPLLTADSSRFVLFPIQHSDVSYLTIVSDASTTSTQSVTNSSEHQHQVLNDNHLTVHDYFCR